MHITKSKNLKEPVILAKILDDGTLLIVDSKTTIRYLDLNTLDVLNGFKVNIEHERYKTSVVAFSNDGKMFSTLSADCKESRLYNADTKKAITKVDRNQGEVSCVAFDNSGKYMFTCGDDGKTFVIDVKSGKIAFTLPVHADTVNDIAFSSNGNWVATVSYDKKVSVYHLSMMTPKQKLKSHAAPIMKVKFIGQNRLISIDKNNSAIIWDIYTGKVLSRLQGVHDDVTQIVLANDDRFLFLGTELGYVIVYDTKTYELLSRDYIKLQSVITSMEFDKVNNNLIVACNNGDVLFYNIYEGEDDLHELLKHQKYDSLQSYVDKNPLISYTKIYDVISNIWENTLSKAKRCLQKNDRKTAMALLSHFKSIPSKNKIIQNILSEYEEYDKFATSAKQGKIALAYSLANIHPVYKDTPLYKALEERWQKAFALAQKHSMDQKGMDKAREVLNPYRGIAEKTKLIQELFNKGEVYNRFRIEVGQKDFKRVFEFIKLHPFLKEFPEYASLISYADTLYIKSQEFINEGDMHSAIKYLRMLFDFPEFSNEAKDIVLNIENKQKFFNAIKEENIELAYTMLDASDDLQLTNDGRKLQMQWDSDLDVAKTYAARGEVKGIKEALSLYMGIKSKYMSLGTVFGWCYMVQIENAIKQKKEQSVIENGIKKYILNFGLQDQILSLHEIFVKRYPKSKLNLELLTEGSLSMWRPSMIFDSILD